MQLKGYMAAPCGQMYPNMNFKYRFAPCSSNHGMFWQWLSHCFRPH